MLLTASSVDTAQQIFLAQERKILINYFSFCLVEDRMKQKTMAPEILFRETI